MANDKQFRPEDHLTNIKGKEYLEVKWRLVWFRQDRPLDSGWGIRTIPEIATEERAVYRAQIVSPEGVVIAEGTKSETQDGFPDFVEKAETGAIGRALAICGYGTQFCGGELDERERIVDSPVDRKPTSAPQKKRKRKPKQKAQPQQASSEPLKQDAPTLGADGKAKFGKWLERASEPIQQAIEKELPAFLAKRWDISTVEDVPAADGAVLQGWARQRIEQIPEELEQAKAEEFFKLKEKAEQMGIPIEGLDTADEIREEIDKVEQAQEVPE